MANGPGMSGRRLLSALVLVLATLPGGWSQANAESGMGVDRRLEALMPRARPLLGPSLVGGTRLLLDPPAASEGTPNRIVRHLPLARHVLEIDVDMVEEHPRYGFQGTFHARILDAGDGGVICRYRMPFDSGVPNLVKTRLGPRGSPGIMIIMDRFLSSAESPTRVLEVTALSSRCKELWTKSWTSTWTSTPTRAAAATDLVVPIDLLTKGGHAADLLLADYDYAGGVLSMTPMIVRGSDGAEQAFQPVVVPWLESTPMPTSVPNLDRDARADWIVIDTSGLGRGLRAHSSVDGQELWHNSEVDAGGGTVATGLGDVTGNAAKDFALGYPLRLVDGGNGKLRWKRPGGTPFSYGDVDSDGRRDMLVLHAFANDRRLGSDVAVVSSRGRRLAKERYAVRRPGSGFSLIVADDAGDTSGDGVGELFLNLVHFGEKLVDERFVIDAVDARPLHRGGSIFPLGGSLRGRADDVIRVRGSGKVTISPISGPSGRVIWRKSVKLAKRSVLSSVPRVVQARGRQRSVLLSFSDRKVGTAMLLDGRSGEALWKRKLR